MLQPTDKIKTDLRIQQNLRDVMQICQKSFVDKNKGFSQKYAFPFFHIIYIIFEIWFFGP